VPRQINRLTQFSIENASKKPGAGIRSLHDGGGLYLVLDGRRSEKDERPTASWIYRYMMHGKARMMGLGPFPAIKLGEARKAVAEARTMKAKGMDPLGVRDAARAERVATLARAITFKQVAADYLRANQVKWSSGKHAAQWTATLKTYVYPIIGESVVGEIDAADVLNVLRQDVAAPGKKPVPLWEARPETASRLRGRIETILDYARVKNLRAGDNPAAWRGNLKLALPATSKVRRVKHHAALPVEQMGAFMAQLRALDGTSARALEFAILTAARTGEVIGASWNEIDLTAGVWIIPAERMKAGREHRVPLSTRAQELLKTLQPVDSDASGFVFPGLRLGKPLSNMAFLMLLRRIGLAEVTAHGFRSTFRDWVSEQTNFPTELAERALAHVVGDKTEAAYARGDLFQRRKDLMAAWATFCATLQKVGSAAAA